MSLSLEISKTSFMHMCILEEKKRETEKWREVERMTKANEIQKVKDYLLLGNPMLSH